jgi:hypothetical protein
VTDKELVSLWVAIDAYVTACGGNPHKLPSENPAVASGMNAIMDVLARHEGALLSRVPGGAYVAFCARYQLLVERWRRETQFLSGMLAETPSGVELQKLGRPIVPFLVEELRGDDYSWAVIDMLWAILKDGPTIQWQERGRIERVRKRWLSWIEKHPLICTPLGGACAPATPCTPAPTGEPGETDACCTSQGEAAG